MKPSSLLNQETAFLFSNDVNFIHSEKNENLISLQLSIISDYINQEEKSCLFIFNKEEQKEIILKLLAIKMNCSLRNIKNPNYISTRKEQYEKELKSIDKYLVIFNNLDIFKAEPEVRVKYCGLHFFFLDINNKSALNNFSSFITKSDNVYNDLCTTFRFCLKLSRVFKSKIFLGVSQSKEIISNLDKESFKNEVSCSFYNLNQKYITDLDKEDNKYYISLSNEKTEINSNLGFKVDPETGLFYMLQDEDVLNLKELLITISRNSGGLISFENKYVKEWIDSYTEYAKIHSNISPLVFMSKAYLSIANKLELKKA